MRSERCRQTVARNPSVARAPSDPRGSGGPLGGDGRAHTDLRALEAGIVGHRMPHPELVISETGWSRDPIDRFCWRCGVTRVPFEDVSQGCGECRGRPSRIGATRIPTRAVVRLGRYGPPLSQWSPAIKQRAWRQMAQRLGVELGRQAIDMIHAGAMPKPDCVVPVPVHWARSLLRGINHAQAIAEAVASELGVACVPALRACLAARQAGGDAADRMGNRGRFTLGRAFARRGAGLGGAEVLLIDDVRTTGSTTLEAGRTLATAGIRGLSIGVLAVVDPPRRASLARNVDKFWARG